MEMGTAMLERLRAMSLGEIAFRGRQEASKAFERLTPAPRATDAGDWLRAHAPSLAGSDAAIRMIREVAPARFFAGNSSSVAWLPRVNTERPRCRPRAMQSIHATE